MTLGRTSRVALVLPLLFLWQLRQPAHGQATGNAVRIVAWQPKPGMEHEFEEGYKRHLEWHRKNADTWAWHGWFIGSGERDGYFVDGTFFHAWADFDSPVSPAGDGADNAVNVVPYADVRSVATYEVVPELTNLEPKELASPLLTFCYLTVAPGRGADFEKLAVGGLRGGLEGGVKHAVLRPANGTSAYVLLLVAEKPSEVGAQAKLISRLLEIAGSNSKGMRVVESYRTETGRYRPDLSNVPSEKKCSRFRREERDSTQTAKNGPMGGYKLSIEGRICTSDFSGCSR